MTHRSHFVGLFAAVLASMGAQYRTTNFVVEAPTPQVAQQIGQYAEHYRKEKAKTWLGYEMPPWPEPCPIHVKLTMGGAGGATSFAFDRGQVLGQTMNIEGTQDRLTASVLPHEVTHTVFAHYFRTPVPRWADEGGAVLSEDDVERNRHDRIVREILNTPGRAIPLRRLFAMRDYPNDVMVLYAEGFSVSEFLVSRSNRPAFLAFVASGMREGWDQAARVHYRYANVDALEQDWLASLRSPRQAAPAMLARNQAPAGDPNGRVVVRQTVPPTPQPAPVVRGQSPEEGDRVGAVPARPAYLPSFASQQGLSPAPAPVDVWQPASAPNQHPRVQLGMPQVFAAPAPMMAPPPPPATLAAPPPPAPPPSGASPGPTYYPGYPQ